MRPWQVCVARPRVLSASCGSPPAASLPPRSPWARWLQSCLLAAFRGAFSSPGLLRPSIPEGRFFLLLQPAQPPTVPCLVHAIIRQGLVALPFPPHLRVWGPALTAPWPGSSSNGLSSRPSSCPPTLLSQAAPSTASSRLATTLPASQKRGSSHFLISRVFGGSSSLRGRVSAPRSGLHSSFSC